MKHNRYWFKQKRYGYGVTPNTWEGWLTLVIFVLAILSGSILIENATYFYAFITLIVLAVIWISKAKTKNRGNGDGVK